MVERCGVWQIKRMTSLDQDQVSMKLNMFSLRGYLQMNFYKTYKTKNRPVWFGKGMYLLLIVKRLGLGLRLGIGMGMGNGNGK